MLIFIAMMICHKMGLFACLLVDRKISKYKTPITFRCRSRTISYLNMGSLAKEVLNALKRRRREIAVTATVLLISSIAALLFVKWMSMDTETKITIQTIPGVSGVMERKIGVVKIYWKDASHFTTALDWTNALDAAFENENQNQLSLVRRHLDHLSLRAGGEEMKVLRGFPFQKISVSEWSISSKSKLVRDGLIRFMIAQSYDCVVHDGKPDSAGVRDVICRLKISAGSTSSVPALLKPGKHIVYVVSLQGVPGANAANEGRFDAFVAHWKRECGDSIQIKLCPGNLDPRRGYGLTLTYVQCIGKAIADGVVAATFLEDDARLFPNVKKFCAKSENGNIFQDHMPRDAFILMLGGHGFEFSLNKPGDGNGLRFMHLLRSLDNCTLKHACV